MKSKRISHRKGENHLKQASHGEEENHVKIASHSRKENQDMKASHLNKENHLLIASHASKENHIKIASHPNQEDQRNLASHESKENHVKVASQRDKGNQMMKATSVTGEIARIIAGSYYDHQEIRITEMNRVRDLIRKRVEKITGVEEKKKEKDYAKKYTDKKLFSMLPKLVEKGEFTTDDKEYIDKLLIVQESSEKFEALYKKLMMELVENQPVYIEFLQHIKGISSVLSANLIKEFGQCENALHISSLWKYCGMHVVDGKAPKREKGIKLDFSIKLRTLCWKISDSFVKQRTPFYRDIYDKEKERQSSFMSHSNGGNQTQSASHVERENQKIIAPQSKLHADLRARRKMVKIFLAHYWMACKEIYSHRRVENQDNAASHKDRENQKIKAPYAQSKLGHRHISDWKDAVMANLSAREKVKNK